MNGGRESGHVRLRLAGRPMYKLPSYPAYWQARTYPPYAFLPVRLDMRYSSYGNLLRYTSLQQMASTHRHHRRSSLSRILLCFIVA
jgi:hypothetical protein